MMLAMDMFVQDSLEETLACRIFRLMNDLHGLTGGVPSSEAQRFLYQGVALRLGIIQENVKFLLDFKPLAESGLLPNEATQLTMHANSLYMHIRGVFDNLAWAIAYACPDNFGTYSKKKWREHRLFDTKFIEKVPFDAFCDLLRKHQGWSKVLRDLRDPIAHRLPIYAVPSVIPEDNSDEHQNLSAKALTAFREGNYEQYSELRRDAAELEIYAPIFGYTQDGQIHPLSIREQVEQDVGFAVEIVEASLSIWNDLAMKNTLNAIKDSALGKLPDSSFRRKGESA